MLKGTGLSSTVTARTLATEGGPAKQAASLKNFRADSIGRSINRVIAYIVQGMTNEECFSHGLRSNSQDFDSGLSGRKEEMDDHGRELWWLLLRNLPFEFVGIPISMQQL